MALVKYITALILVGFTLMSCNSDKSLQRYLVDKQEDDKFLKVDVAASLLQTDNNNMSEDQKEILNTIKKVNVVAYPIKDGNMTEYKAEKDKLATIIGQEKYKLLMKMGSNKSGATLKYLGEEDAIDEIIIFATDTERGFAIFRVLGDDMRPDKMIKLMNSIEKGDVDVTKFTGIGDLFGEIEAEDL